LSSLVDCMYSLLSTSRNLPQLKGSLFYNVCFFSLGLVSSTL
jgi:hypothetical protein